MYQYEMYFTNEYLFEIVEDLSKIMEIKFEKERLLKAYNFEERNNMNNLFISYFDDNKYFICIDCDNKDWIYPLVVRCPSKYQEKINACMLKWDNNIRTEYGQSLTKSIENMLNKEITILKNIENKYNISLS